MGTSVDDEVRSPEEIVASDLMDLRAGSKVAGFDLTSRVKYGLDPASMLAVRDTAPLTERIAQALHAHLEEDGSGVAGETPRQLIARLHREGPWNLAERLRNADDPNIQFYIVLAHACEESSSREGFTPAEYARNKRDVVLPRLSSFASIKGNDSAIAEARQRRQEIIDTRLKGMEKRLVSVDGAEVEVPVADGDPALPLAMLGYFACVTRAGEMRFAQTTRIDDKILVRLGLEKGWAEVFNSEKNNFERVDVDNAPAGARVVWVRNSEKGKPLEVMEPSVKRIWPGYVLAYNDENLALQIAAMAILESNV